MKISERCSCGASIKLEDEQALTVVREWRRKHKCLESEDDVQAVYGSSAQVENAIGFTATGLNDPARSPYPDWDDD